MINNEGRIDKNLIETFTAGVSVKILDYMFMILAGHPITVNKSFTCATR